MSDERDESLRLPDLGQALQKIQEVGAQLTSAARSMANELARSPGERFIEPIARLTAQTVELSTMWVRPVRAILDEQQDLIEAITLWASQQRDLADRFARLAERNKQLNDMLMTTVGPVLESTERLANLFRPSPDETPS